MNTYPGMDTVKVDIVMVTPQLAAEWLAKNRKNRKVRFSHVNKLTHTFGAGQYIMTGETVKFDVNGDLIDAQHRLLGVINADVTVPMIVVTGLPVEAYEVIDSGVKKTVGDKLGGLGIKNPNDLAAMAKIALALRRGINPNNPTAVNQSITDIDQQHEVRELEETYYKACRLAGTLFKKSAAGGLFVHLMQLGFDDEDIESFAEGITTGSDLGGKDPRLAVRNWIIKRRSVRQNVDKVVELEVLIRAWNAYVTGRPLSLVKSIARKGVEFPKVLAPEDVFEAAVA
jgi:hypothetical protein